MSDLHFKKQKKRDIVYLKMAKKWSSLSYSKRLKVGCLIVKNNMIVSDGYNGTPTGFDNKCEDSNFITKWFVIHSEANAILKCAKKGISCEGSTIYQTYSPCKECSKLILQSGIKRVVYNKNYRDTKGIKFLKKAGILVEKLNIN